MMNNVTKSPTVDNTTVCAGAWRRRRRIPVVRSNEGYSCILSGASVRESRPVIAPQLRLLLKDMKSNLSGLSPSVCLQAVRIQREEEEEGGAYSLFIYTVQ